MALIGPPAPRPCESCPYRRDVASGIWDEKEYAKLEPYDNDIAQQPQQLFACHQTDLSSQRARLCAGWVGCHGGANLLAVRLAPLNGSMTAADTRETMAYVSPEALFGSAHEAAQHGREEIDDPGDRARRSIGKIVHTRSDLRS